MTSVILWSALIILMLAGVPVAFSMGISSILLLLSGGTSNAVVIAQKVINGLDSFTMLSIPFFMMAAAIMTETGVADRIFDFASSVVRHVPGGLGQVNIVASVIQAGMSGSAVSDVTGIGRLEINAMVRAGYDRPFSCAVTAASSTIGPIIPPSIPMVLYGSIAGVSIGRLLIGGLMPGILMSIAMAVTVYIISKRRNYPLFPRASLRELWKGFIGALPSLLMPVILLGGIMQGFMTPTESACAAVLYALFLGFVFYRTLTLKTLMKVMRECAIMCATTMFIIASASIFGMVLTQLQIPLKIAAFFIGLSDNINVILLAVNIMLLVLGCVLETTSIFVILTPVLSLLAIQLGLDPVHFGIMVVFNVTVALLTPPVGMVMFLTCKVGEIQTMDFVRAIVPFLLCLVVSLVLVTYVPWFSTWLPNLLMGT